ncbi:MAG: hypothetical protein Q8L26_03565 [Candidatus Omnitrophota bacterium]|nr:hypothetical protein [Candidatus Omnitrophota bacterium]
MKKLVYSLGLIVCSLIAMGAFSEAAAWESIPVLPGSTIERKQELQVNAHPAEVTLYKNNAQPDEVFDFYKTQMVNSGWEELMSKNESGYGLMSFFRKDKVAVISIQNAAKGAAIMVTQTIREKESMLYPDTRAAVEKADKSKADNPEGITPGSKAGCKDNLMESKLFKEDTPGKDLDSVPRYRGAVRINSVINEHPKKRATLVYTAQANSKEVLDFYRQNMPYYNWQLKDEMNFADFPEKLSSKLKDIKGLLDPENRGLTFQGYYKSCMVTVTKDPSKEGYVIIGVNYYEK